jgi:pimeloyl-ACP methyl ester carboxylesterase
MSTFVLVHGGWHGAWCWHRVTPLLMRLGHAVFTPDLPGHGSDRTPAGDITLQNYLTSVGSILAEQRQPVILAGHSMGGIVITQCAEQWPDRIGALVYIAAFLPASGESLAGLAEGDAESLIPPNSVPTADGLAVTLRDAALPEMLYADCPADDVALARARIVPEPLAPLATPVCTTAGNFGRVPRAYIECRRDRALPLARQRRMQAALPCRPVFAMDTGHSPFFAAPQALVEYLASLAMEFDPGQRRR